MQSQSILTGKAFKLKFYSAHPRAIHHIICARVLVCISRSPVLIFHISNFLSVTFFLAKTIFIFLFRWCVYVCCVFVCLCVFFSFPFSTLAHPCTYSLCCMHTFVIFVCLFFVSFVKQSHQKFKVVIKVWVHMQWGYKKVKRTITRRKTTSTSATRPTAAAVTAAVAPTTTRLQMSNHGMNERTHNNALRIRLKREHNC